jgi:hypothetical protein
MAPNLKRLTFTLDAEYDLQVIRQKEVIAPPAQPQPDNSVSYWDWSSDTPVDYFSADHIESNLVQSNVSTEEPCLNESSDEYWAEANDQEMENCEEPLQAQHQSSQAPTPPQDVESYWKWSHAPTESDLYWADNNATPRKAPVQQQDSYWNWSHASTQCDKYWNMPAAREESKNYWAWSHATTESDDYWNMPSVAAC